MTPKWLKTEEGRRGWEFDSKKNKGGRSSKQGNPEGKGKEGKGSFVGVPRDGVISSRDYTSARHIWLCIDPFGYVSST